MTTPTTTIIFRGARPAVGKTLIAAACAQWCARAKIRALAADMRLNEYRMRGYLAAEKIPPNDGLLTGGKNRPDIFSAAAFADEKSAVIRLAELSEDYRAVFIAADSPHDFGVSAATALVFTYAADDIIAAKKISDEIGEAAILIPSWADRNFPMLSAVRLRACEMLGAELESLAACEIPYSPQLSGAQNLTAEQLGDIAPLFCEPVAHLCKDVFGIEASEAIPQADSESESSEEIKNESNNEESKEESDPPPPPSLAAKKEKDEGNEVRIKIKAARDAFGDMI